MLQVRSFKRFSSVQNPTKRLSLGCEDIPPAAVASMQDTPSSYLIGCWAVPAIISSQLLNQNFEVWVKTIGTLTIYTSTDAGTQTRIRAESAH